MTRSQATLPTSWTTFTQSSTKWSRCTNKTESNALFWKGKLRASALTTSLSPFAFALSIIGTEISTPTTRNPLSFKGQANRPVPTPTSRTVVHFLSISCLPSILDRITSGDKPLADRQPPTTLPTETTTPNVQNL